MNFQRTRTVFGKELTDGFRDRRAIYSVLIGALISPLLMAFLLNRLAGEQRGAREIRVPIVGREYAPILVDWLEQQSGVETVPGPADPEQAVRSRQEDFVLVIEKEFGEKFQESRPAPVQVVADSTRQTSRAKLQRLRTLLLRFSAETGSLRLVARGISPSVANALRVQDVEVSSAQQRAAQIFNVFPMFIVLAAFMAGMQIATDSTAGERERGSFEPLLVNPVLRSELVAGKWAAAVVSAAVGMIISLTFTFGTIMFLRLEDLGFRVRFSVFDAIMLLAATIPMAVLGPAIQVYFATFAKSYKEAQSYMGFLVLVPMIPGIAASFTPLGNRPWMAPIPILGQYSLATDVLSGKFPPSYALVIGALSATALALVFVGLTTRLFFKERIIFGR
jgi:sodium transport system permease protein